MSISENWVLAERKTNEGLSLVRMRKLESSFQFKVHRERMSIIWRLQDRTPDRTPSPEESDFMERFESRLCELLEPSAYAFLSIVFTEPGFREYVFYSREIKRFVAAVNKLPKESASYPIEIHHESDSSGQFYQSYAERLLG
jgi:Family of unknown function (DUF695)